MATAFVFAGGASFGAVQVGMLRSLVAHGIRPDFVVGSSAGAINAAYVAAAPDEAGVARLDALWRGLRCSEVFLSRGVSPGSNRRSPPGRRRGGEQHAGGRRRRARRAAHHRAAHGLRLRPRGDAAHQIVEQIRQLRDRVEIVTVPPLCPLSVSPYDFSRGAELIERSATRTTRWLEKGGLGKHRIPGALQPHED